MNKTIGAIIVVIVAVAAGWYLLSGRTTDKSDMTTNSNDIVATVNGTSITRGQLTMSETQVAEQQGMTATSTTALAQFQSSALDLLIGRMLIEQAAQQAGIIASSTEVDAQLASTKTQFSTESDYEKALAAKGMTEDSLRAQISSNLVINSYLEKQLKLSAVTATTAEIQAMYKQITSQTGTSTPPLSQVRDQVAQSIVRQKQQISVNTYVAQLRSAANVQILIATSTPVQ